MAGWYELSKSADGQFTFVLKAGNGEVVLTGELYRARASAEGGIASVRAHCRMDEQYERKGSANGKFYFVLEARNSQAIGTSQMYASASSRDDGIASVMANGTTTKVKDKTAGERGAILARRPVEDSSRRGRVAMRTLNLDKAVRRVTVIRSTGSGEAEPLVVHRRRSRKKKQSKALRPLEKLARRLVDAQVAAGQVYADGHRRANTKKKNGWARKLGSNLRRARKKFLKKLR